MPELQECAKLPHHLLANARLLPDRYDILPLLPKGKVIAEVGVALGDFSENFLRICQPRTFIAIDIFNIHEMPMLWGKPTAELFRNRTHSEFYQDRFAEPIRRGGMIVFKEDSAKALEQLGDKSVDVFYVDANHTYESVSAELSIIKRKITDDGFIIMNDYIMNEAGFSNAPYGVIQATNEFMISENWEMTYFALQPYMYCDVVLRKVGEAAFSGSTMWAPKETLAAMLQERLTAIEQQNTELRQALDAVRASTSWRVTAPLRTLRNWQRNRSSERGFTGYSPTGSSDIE